MKVLLLGGLLLHGFKLELNLSKTDLNTQFGKALSERALSEERFAHFSQEMGPKPMPPTEGKTEPLADNLGGGLQETLIRKLLAKE